MIRFALGYTDTEGRTWFIHRAATFGNMLRTDDPHQSRAFPAVFELQNWVESLPGHAKAQLAGRDLLIFPIDFRAGEPTHRLRLDLDTPALDGAENAPGPSVALSPIPPRTISARTLIGA
jgi:hypothetical protein